MKNNAIARWQIIVVLLFVATLSNAQNVSNGAAINNQFDFILNKSESYRDLKIVKTKLIENLQNTVSHSYTTMEGQLHESKTLIQKQNSKIIQLQSDLQKANFSLSKYTNATPTVTVFGIQFNQVIFATLFGIVFFGSIIAVIFFAVRFKKSRAIAQHSKSVLSDLEQEYQQHKERAIAREQKISRQLQDEINKQKQFLKMKAS